MHMPSLKTTLAAAALALGTTIGAWVGGAGDARADTTVFAAASTTNALQEIITAFNETGHGTVVPSFASSSTLAKQIEQGAPAGVFLSANVKWMDYLADKDMVVTGSRVDLLGNRLALIAPLDTGLAVEAISAETPLADMLDGGRLSLGDPEHVPAGIYAKKALETLGLWDSVASMVAPGSDVRAALALVERGEAPLGIVYSTDAAVTDQVTTLGLFPADSHPAITYPVALIAGQDNDTAKAFLTFLQGTEAAAVFERYGFQVNQK